MTVAPGIVAPDASVIVPEILPVPAVFWADSVQESTAIKHATDTKVRIIENP
jgi:hypothetical protein